MNKQKESNTYRVISKHILMSPFKLRRVGKLIRGKEVNYALSILKNLPHRGSHYLIKVIESCLANMKHNHKVNIGSEKIKIDTLLINGGPLIKRFQPKARGRMYKILKRTSHIDLKLTLEGRAL